jgi:RNA polymerase sigma factor (sigma-70 family)
VNGLQDGGGVSGGARGQGVFMTTHWTTVVSAGHPESAQGDEAMGRLCRTYWYPLYIYVRRQGYDADEAQDLTQEFFARLLARNFLRNIDRSRGKFRWFLMAAMEHFLAKEWRDARRLKRGGGQAVFSLDEVDAENRYRIEPEEPMTAERIYERRWAMMLLDQALQRLRGEFVEAKKAAVFEALQIFLSGERPDVTQEQAGERLGMTKGAVNVAVHRLRKRYGELLREEIAETVSSPDGVEEELRYLQKVLNRS